MIQTDSQARKYQTKFTNGEAASQADTSADKGGTGHGFRPHELLEAALASCMNMTLRMVAERKEIPLADVAVQVSLDRSDPEHPVFEYSAQFHGELSPAQRDSLLAVMDRCPVRKTLSKPLQFRLVDQ
jgi:putative redox protein